MPLAAFALPPNHAVLTQPSRPRLSRRQRPSPPCRDQPHRRLRATLIRLGDEHDSATLSSFTERVRGEWTGYEGTFDSSTGRPDPVADYYIPEQFVEWGLVPHGFESTHSIIVRGSTLYRKFFRVLPAVSLFADHVDLEEDFRALDLAADPAAHVFVDGSFATGPGKVCVKKASALDKWPAAELCLRDPREGEQRALHVALSFDFEKRELVGSLRVILEKWSCIYCDGADIEGSSGYVEGWVIEEPAHPDALAGKWKAVSGEEETVVERSGPEVVPRKQLFLPKGIDVAVEGGEGVHIQVGWLVDDATRVVLKRSFGQDGGVVSSQRIVEYRV